MKKRNRSNDEWAERSGHRPAEESADHPDTGPAPASGGLSDAVIHQYGEPVRFVGTYRPADGEPVSAEQKPRPVRHAAGPRGAAPDCRAQDFGLDTHVDDAYLINPEADQWPMYAEKRRPPADSRSSRAPL